jgi:hypothetical protein
MSTVITPSFALTLGNLRSLVVPNYTGETLPSVVTVSPRGALIVNQDLPERAELTRLGAGVVQRTAAVAAVTAIPTTTASATLWNGEQPGGKVYIIDAINVTCTSSNGAASMFSIVAMVPIATSATVPATSDTVVANSLSGRTYAGKGQCSHAVTVVDNGWFSIGNTFNTGALTATVGAQVEIPVNGSIVLAPQYLLALACVAQSGTANVKFSIRYFEVQLPAVTV